MKKNLTLTPLLPSNHSTQIAFRSLFSLFTFQKTDFEMTNFEPPRYPYPPHSSPTRLNS